MSTLLPVRHDGSWHPPHQEISLFPTDVHIWKVELLPPEHQRPLLYPHLSRDEQDRAQAMKSSDHRQRFITARGILRILLSRYLNTQTHDLRFSHGPHGKPFLHTPYSSPRLSFNLSHSHHMALYAFSLNREVGIDIEYTKRSRNVSSLISRVCSEQEKAMLTSRITTEQNRMFLACWTRKEAYLKATGEGITFPLNSLTVSLPPDSISLERSDRVSQEDLRWTVHEIHAAPDYTAALVVEGQDWHPTYWEWVWE